MPFTLHRLRPTGQGKHRQVDVPLGRKPDHWIFQPGRLRHSIDAGVARMLRMATELQCQQPPTGHSLLRVVRVDHVPVRHQELVGAGSVPLPDDESGSGAPAWFRSTHFEELRCQPYGIQGCRGDLSERAASCHWKDFKAAKIQDSDHYSLTIPRPKAPGRRNYTLDMGV